MATRSGTTFEAEFWPVEGNVRAELQFDGLTIRFTAAPDKMRALVAAITRAADEADRQMPSMES